MKKFKISMIAVMAIVLGIAASAFTAKPTVKHNHTMHFIQFTGSDNSKPEIEASGNWLDLGTDEPTLTCDEASGVVCYVEYNGTLSQFQSYVSNKTITDLQNAGIIQEYRTS